MRVYLQLVRSQSVVGIYRSNMFVIKDNVYNKKHICYSIKYDDGQLMIMSRKTFSQLLRRMLLISPLSSSSYTKLLLVYLLARLTLEMREA